LDAEPLLVGALHIVTFTDPCTGKTRRLGTSKTMIGSTGPAGNEVRDVLAGSNQLLGSIRDFVLVHKN
jgi:hypothetical protein